MDRLTAMLLIPFLVAVGSLTHLIAQMIAKLGVEEGGDEVHHHWHSQQFQPQDSSGTHDEKPEEEELE